MDLSVRKSETGSPLIGVREMGEGLGEAEGAKRRRRRV